jgi:superfamily I DNA/RNA helicase
MSFEWSHEQNAIFDYVLTGIGHLVVIARAGCAKTSVIVESAKRYVTAHPTKRILVCAFNVRNRDELQEKLKGHRQVTVWTYNQLGFWFVRNAWRGIQVDTEKGWACARASVVEAGKIDPRKPIARTLSALPGVDQSAPVVEQEQSPDERWVERVVPLARLAKSTLPDSIQALTALCQKHGFDDENHDATVIAAITGRAMQLSIERTNTCDLDDQIYLPVAYDLSCPKPFDLVLSDESQDCTKGQLWLMQRSIVNATGSEGRIIMVLDPNQAAYAFRGADYESVDAIIKSLNAPTLPLPISYRCAKNIIKDAQRYVPDIRSTEWAMDGEVIRVRDEFAPQHDDDGDDDAADAAEATDARDRQPSIENDARVGDVVISRKNSALVPICFSLRDAGKPAIIIGRDPGRLLGLVKRMHARSSQQLIDAMLAYRAEHVSEAMEKGQERLVKEIMDECDTIISVAKRASNVYDVMEQIRAAFVKSGVDIDKQSIITCSTVHGYKGFETDRVWILGWTFNDADREELNLQYIAVTRAKHTVFWIGDPEHIDPANAIKNRRPIALTETPNARPVHGRERGEREADQYERERDANRHDRSRGSTDYVRRQRGFGWDKK